MGGDESGGDTMPKPGPSEWGKLSAGQSFGMLATDFGRALFAVAWGRYELLLIGYLMEHSWGAVRSKSGRDHWPDPLPVRPNFHQLSMLWRVPCQRLYEARDSLKAKGFAVESDEGLWINKDAGAWVDPRSGGPLVPAPLLSYAMDGRTRKGATDKHADFTPQREPISEALSRPSVKDSRSGVNGHASRFHAPACNDFTPQRETISRPSVKSPIEDHAREDSEIKDSLRPAPAGAGDDWDEAHRGAVEEARSLFGDAHANVVAQKGDDIAESVRGPMVADRADTFRFYRAALREVRRRADAGKQVRNFHPLALSIANDWGRTGIPPEPLGVEPRASPAAPTLAEKAAALKARWAELEEAKRGR